MADDVNKKCSFAFLVVFVQIYGVFGGEGLPNIVLLVVDNVGMSDLGWFGNKTVETPNIDKLTSGGVRFTRWYSQSTSMSTRASILTGNLPIRTGIIKSRYLPYTVMPSLASSGGLNQDHITLAEVLKNMGYSTSYVGLWGMGIGRKGAFLPTHQGFDHWYGVPGLHNNYCVIKTFNATNQSLHNSHEYPNEERSVVYLLIVLVFTFMVATLVALWAFRKIDTTTLVLLATPELFVIYMSYFSVHLMDFFQSRNCVLYRDKTIIEQPFIVNNMSMRFTRETVHLIKDFSHKRRPFFVMHSYIKMHKPLYLSHTFSNCSKDLFSCSLMELDWSVGKIVKTIEDAQLENNTIIIFTSTGGSCLESRYDCHRGHGYVTDKDGQLRPLKGGGNTIWEGDIRVPTIIQWKGKVEPGQTISHATTSMDLLPTFLELINLITLDTFDGKSVFKMLFNSSIGPQHDVIFHYFDIYKPAAISYGQYKLVYITLSDDETTLYHDPPLLYDVDADPSETTPIPVDQFPDNLLSIVSTLLEEHLSNRTDKGISQFDHPFLPLYFPCANLITCRQKNNELDDFSELMGDMELES